jgi:hypothetical protein
VSEHDFLRHDRILRRRNAWRRMLRLAPGTARDLLLRVSAGAALGGLAGFAAAAVAELLGAHP